MEDVKFGLNCYGIRYDAGPDRTIGVGDMEDGSLDEGAYIDNANEARRLAAWLLVQAEWMEGNQDG